ncbi:MAG: hypothetical protein A2064_02955 [Spirochaetes bacterium GWB1_66_5]|nr:MAG: hypothetical protein A2064_02955 [Spirochaetes bacterium GWB1_66_5]
MNRRPISALPVLVLLLAVAAAGWAKGVREPQQPETQAQPAGAPRKAALDSEDPCLACHAAGTPGLVESWRLSRHAAAGVGCAACHTPSASDPSGAEHFGAKVTPVVSPQYCAACHPGEVAQNRRSKHAWTAFIGNLRPYYAEARARGLDPFSQETARRLDPDEMARRNVSSMFPDSGVLKATGLLERPGFSHNNVNLGCAQCHGTFVVVQPDGKLAGWPNTGIGRVNPDGSLGSCSSCHTRHKFSVEEARKPETCGQCHLGPDHPQIEIYEESKHGNIYASNGESWNWDAPSGKWGPEQVEAPTCAACHLSGFGGQVAATHDPGERLYWELQPPKSVPQWKNAEQVKDLVLERVPDETQAAEGRKRMKSVCLQCHSPRWVDGYFDEFDQVVGDYNLAWDYVDRLLQEAYAQGLAAKDNPLDEPPEIYHYLIWHHSGRRWRMGAAMMGPDWTHWNGAVDTLMINLGLMRGELESRRQLQELRKARR